MTPPPPYGSDRARFSPPGPVAPPSESFEVPREPADDDGMTRMMGGADLQRLKVPRKNLTLQIMDQRGQWHNWSTLSASGLKIGRAEKTAQFPELNSMAVRHMRVTADGPRIKVEDLGSLNGVFLRVTQPIGLTEGARFRVGSQVLEFRLAETLGTIAPKVADDGEEFWCRAVEPLAYLDVLRPDGEVGFRYPITSAEGAVMGAKAVLVGRYTWRSRATTWSAASMPRFEEWARRSLSKI